MVIVLVQLGLTLAAKPSPVNREAIRYTLRLPAVDKIELQKLKPEGRTFEAVEATKVIEGARHEPSRRCGGNRTTARSPRSVTTLRSASSFMRKVN